MRKIMICLFVIFAMTSCTLKEKMTMNEDGSGTFSYGFDMSPMFKMGMKKIDSTKVNKVIDTSFTFKEIFDKAKDSIAKLPQFEKQALKVLENFKISLKINEEKKQFEYVMAFDFPDIKDLHDVASPAESLEVLALSDKKRLGALSSLSKPENKVKTSIFYDGKVFIKTVIPAKGDKKVKKKKEKKKEETDDPFSKKMDEMLKECKYIAEYHFPKKIKTVSVKNAVIATDRKSFIVEIPLDNPQENNVEFGFKVEFEE